jgi:hypothetical protein
MFLSVYNAMLLSICETSRVSLHKLQAKTHITTNWVCEVMVVILNTTRMDEGIKSEMHVFKQLVTNRAITLPTYQHTNIPRSRRRD